MSGFTFSVPATTAHLGPGFGVLGLALDLHFEITVRTSDFDGIVVERPGDSSGSALDMRHDAILRALHAARDLWKLKLPPGLTIVVAGDVPRGCGLGSNSADFAAGLGTALHFAKTRPPLAEQLDLLVALGADPGHGAAALAGGLVIAVHHAPPSRRAVTEATVATRFRVLDHPIDPRWRFVIAVPARASGTADVHRVVPASLPHGIVARTSGRLVGLLRALAEGDEDLLAWCLVDESHVPFRIEAAPAVRAAIEAGNRAAASATLSGHGPAVIALTTDVKQCAKIGEALVGAFAEHQVDADYLTCAAAHRR